MGAQEMGVVDEEGDESAHGNGRTSPSEGGVSRDN